MVEGIEGISRSANLKSINLAESNKKNEQVKIEIKDSTTSENKLSHEELRQELEEKIEDMNKITETLEENLSFKLHDETERIMVQVVNVKTKEVVKEMPPEEMLDLAAKIHKMVGLLIDEKV
ncbi:MAG: flagellar protein FlaG [Bacillota bacterium]